MKDNIIGLFLSDKGKIIHEKISSAISDYHMEDALNKGVLVGFSGGADSVMLLSFLAYHSNFGKKFPIVAVHVNHMIRGGEAERDELFAKTFCSSLGIEIIAHKVDVPAIANEAKMGLEECARSCRYSCFEEIICSRNNISTICVAHNADDNLETVILNMMRGCGTRGMAGIPPVRDNIVRPLIYLAKSEIVSVLSEFGIGYVVDSTNLENDYKRNYLRNKVMPLLREVSQNPEAMAARASKNLRADDDFICSVSEEFLYSHKFVKNRDLLSLHDAVFSRVLGAMCRTNISSTNVSEIKTLLRGDNFSYSLPGGKIFVCEYGVCRVTDSKVLCNDDFSAILNFGLNKFDEYDADVILSSEKNQNYSSNVYKFSIQANLASAIIEGDLYLRQKKDGDVIKYGGMTHKLKKLFNDRKIPPSVRGLIPVVCDNRGVLFVPGFGVRDDNVDISERKNLFVTLCIGKCEEYKEIRFHSGNEKFK